MKRFMFLAAGIAVLGFAQAAEPGISYQMTLVDLQGNKQVLGTVPGSVFAPRISPDGRHVAFEMTVPGENAGDPPLTLLHVAPLNDFPKQKRLQITVTSKRNGAPVWAPENDRIAFVATGNGADALFWQRWDGGEQPRYITEGRAPEGIYPDGRLLFTTLAGEGDYGISAVDLATKQVMKLVDLPGSAQHSSQISRDGRWIAYASNETGRYEVWAEPLPANGQRFQLTRNGGSHPVWAPDDSAIYFEQDGRLHRLGLRVDGAELKADETAQLPISGFQQGPVRRQFDLLPDGKSLLMLFPAPATN